MTRSMSRSSAGWSSAFRSKEPSNRGAAWDGTTPHLSDETLVGEVLAGNRELFSQLVDRHQGSLLRQAQAMGLDDDTARDLVQDAFVRAFEQLKGFKHRDRFRVWVGTVLRNRCLDYLKRPSIRFRDPLTPLIVDPGEGPHARTERRLLADAIERAMSALPLEQREAFVLRHVEGLSYEDLAEVTGVSESAAKMRVHRAREALRARLEGRFGVRAEDPGVTDPGGSSSSH
jgi:RNA polymerase sigma-70 factor, ECF subfamily